MAFNRKHTEEEKKKISERMKRYYREVITAEENEERKEKLRQINKRKEDVYKFFLDNLHVINKAIKQEKRKHKRDDDDINNN